MLMATLFHLGRGDGLKGAAHAIEVGIVFLSLILIGPGKYSLDEKLSSDGGDRRIMPLKIQRKLDGRKRLL